MNEEYEVCEHCGRIDEDVMRRGCDLILCDECADSLDSCEAD